MRRQSGADSTRAQCQIKAVTWVGPLTALAFVLIIGTWERFPGGKQIGNYVGMIPSEDSSAGRQRLGHIVGPD